MTALTGTRTRFRPTVAVVDLEAIRHNVRAVRPASAEVMAVVKADGYGHGALPVARAALEAGASWLGVALVEEGIELRDAGVTAPILVLTELPPGSEPAAVAAGLTPALYTQQGLAALAARAHDADRPIGVHVKLDTGMHRVGLPPDQAEAFVRGAVDGGLEFEGLWTHLATAERPDDPFTRRQLATFGSVSEQLAAAGLVPRYRHVANSAAIMALPETHLDLVRLGVSLYGLSPGPGVFGSDRLRPALSFRTEVAMAKRVAAGEAVSYGLRYRLARTSTIATIPVGYADGFPRALTGNGQVLIRGRRYPVAGTVCMDQFMVDCGDDPVEAGDEVVLIGSQGDERITADEVAEWMDTINYEVVCAISRRVPREYLGA
ncbi:MAG TPA: alanine racemase [Actinomycetota bacterium]|nr:alanine racemase [Actinomycetota bacterium]